MVPLIGVQIPNNFFCWFFLQMVPSIQKRMKNPGGPLKNCFYASLNDDNLRKMVQNEEYKFFGNLSML